MSSYKVDVDYGISPGDEVVMTSDKDGMTKDKIYTVVALCNDMVAVVNDKGQSDWVQYKNFEKPL